MSARKSDDMRARRNRPSTAAILPREHDVSTPLLPQDRSWSEQAIAWWFSVWRSPMASQYGEADTPALLALAVLVDEFWTAEDAGQRVRLASEIRLRGEQFGLTPVARQRLGWRIAPEAERRRDVHGHGDGADPRAVLGSNVVPLRPEPLQ
jgi:hypothetical protein